MFPVLYCTDQELPRPIRSAAVSVEHHDGRSVRTAYHRTWNEASKAANTGIQNIRQFLGRAFPALVVGFVGATALGEGMSPVAFILFTASAAIIAVMRPLMVSRTQGQQYPERSRGSQALHGHGRKRADVRPPDETRNCLKGSFHMLLHLTLAKTWDNRFEKF